MGLSQGMAVLVLHDHFAILGDSDDIDPIGKLEHEPGRDLCSGRQLDTLLPYGEPLSEMEDVLTLEYTPRAVFQFRVHRSWIFAWAARCSLMQK